MFLSAMGLLSSTIPWQATLHMCLTAFICHTHCLWCYSNNSFKPNRQLTHTVHAWLNIMNIQDFQQCSKWKGTLRQLTERLLSFFLINNIQFRMQSALALFQFRPPFPFRPFGGKGCLDLITLQWYL